MNEHPAQANRMDWFLNPDRTALTFDVGHLFGLIRVRGHFGKVSATARSSLDGLLERLEVAVDASSLDTKVRRRDIHLIGKDFLHAAEHPVMTFRSTEMAPRPAAPSGVEPSSKRRYRVTGDLTIRGMTHEAHFDLEVSRVSDDRMTATLFGSLCRRQWGITFGLLVIGDEVRFSATLEAAPASLCA